MKKILLSLFLALPALGQTVTPPTSLTPISGTVTLNDYIVLGSDGLLHIGTPAQMTAQAQASGVVLTTGTYSDPSWLTGVHFSILDNLPTTISGYGIADGVTLTGTQTLTNKSIAVSELTGTLTIGQLPALVDAVNVVTGSGTTTATGTLALAVTGTGTGAISMSYGSGTVTINVPTPTTYTLPTASTGTLGGVMIDGTTVVISSGTISVPTAATSTLGLVKPDGTSITISGGVISATPYTLPAATTSVLGGVKIDGTSITINGSNVISATAYSLPTASTSVLGGVKVDGTTITISGGVISSTTSGGTVTSIAVAVPTGFSVSGSPVTSSGTITIGLSNETANEFWAGPASGSAAAPAFRFLVPADLPVATSSAFGAVKPDNSTITISGGVISSSGIAALDTNFSAIASIGSGTLTLTNPANGASGVVMGHASGTPTLAIQAGLAGSSDSISGTDACGYITLSPAFGNSTGTFMSVTFAHAYTTAPNAVVVLPANAAAAGLVGNNEVYVDQANIGTGTFSISCTATNLSTSATYKWFYYVPHNY